MRIDVNDTRLWFDVEGSALVPDRGEAPRPDGREIVELRPGAAASSPAGRTTPPRSERVAQADARGPFPDATTRFGWICG